MSVSQFEALTAEIVRFLRGKYRLDEEECSHKNIPSVRFRQGSKAILTIDIFPDHYGFQIVFGKADREKFEEHRSELPDYILEIYDKTPAYRDGQWLYFKVDSLEVFEDIKKLIYIKKKPNRKPFPKENAVYGKCGHRCDLCVHYTESGFSDEFRAELEERLTRVYDWSDWSMRCTGCGTEDCYTDSCVQVECAKEKGCEKCTACKEYPCSKATVGYAKLEAKNIKADDVTWAILPYVANQYGN